MGADDALGLMNQLLWNSAIVAAPVMLAGLAVGLLVSVLQVATQLQESTLSYIPKLFVAAAVLLMLGPWMISRVTQFAVTTMAVIPTLG